MPGLARCIASSDNSDRNKRLHAVDGPDKYLGSRLVLLATPL